MIALVENSEAGKKYFTHAKILHLGNVHVIKMIEMRYF